MYLFHLTLQALRKPSESINRLTMLKRTLLLTPVLLLITLDNEEVITYIVYISLHNGTNKPKWVSVYPMLYDMIV